MKLKPQTFKSNKPPTAYKCVTLLDINIGTYKHFLIDKIYLIINTPVNNKSFKNHLNLP